MIHFTSIFCIWCKVRVWFHSFACVYLLFPTSFVEKTSLSSLNHLGTLVKNHLNTYVIVYLWALGFFLLTSISVFMPLPYYFDYSRFEISFKIRKCEKSNFILFFFFRSFWLVRSLQIPHEFYYGFFYVCKIMSLDFALILDAFNHCVKSSFNPPLSEDFHGFPTFWRWYFMRIFHFSCHTRKLK